MGFRVALITRRFWPFVGVGEHALTDLACGLRKAGADVTVVTAQWESHWPAELHHREIRVVRLPSPNVSGWGSFRYMRALRRWLQRNRESLDAVLVSRLHHDAHAAVSSLAGSLPVLVRNERAGEIGDLAWHMRSRFGSRMLKRITQADLLIAPSAETAAEARQAGFREEQIVRIANGVTLPDGPRTAESRLAARRALAEANHDLAAHPQTGVAIYIGDLDRGLGLEQMIRAFRGVIAKAPNSQLWLIGDGPGRGALHRDIVDMGLHHHIFMPGGFDDLDDLLAAADICIAPGDQDSLSYQAMKAMSHEAPVVAANIPGNRELLEHGESGWLAPPGNALAWSEAIIYILENPAIRQSLGRQAKLRVKANFTDEQMAHAHLQLIHAALESQAIDSQTA